MSLGLKLAVSSGSLTSSADAVGKATISNRSRCGFRGREKLYRLMDERNSHSRNIHGFDHVAQVTRGVPRRDHRLSLAPAIRRAHLERIEPSRCGLERHRPGPKRIFAQVSTQTCIALVADIGLDPSALKAALGTEPHPYSAVLRPYFAVRTEFCILAR